MELTSVSVIDLGGRLQRSLDDLGEPGSAVLCDLLRDLLDGVDLGDRAFGLHRLKARVYRLEVGSSAPWRSVVLKRVEPAVSQRTWLVAERWLPALHLGDRCARLLGVAADRDGRAVWHVYEDLGVETLADSQHPAWVEATVDCIAELHTRAAGHAVLPDVRRYGGDLGIRYFTTNVEDAIAALEALRPAGIEPPADDAALPGRLLARLRDLLADAPRRARALEEMGGPETLIHGDLWTVNVFVDATAAGLRARLVDWDRVGVGPFSYDLSTFLHRFPAEQRPWIVECYRRAVARAGWHLGPSRELDVLFDTAERARYANRLIWPALALVRERADWGFAELAEVERWFRALDTERPDQL